MAQGYNDAFEPRNRPREELLTGTAKEWYSNAIGRSFECNSCDEQFHVEEEMVTLSGSGEAPSVVDKLRSYVGGGNAHRLSDETVENGLFTDDGALVQGVVVCPFCLQQHGHHYDSTIRQLGLPSR